MRRGLFLTAGFLAAGGCLAATVAGADVLRATVTVRLTPEYCAEVGRIATLAHLHLALGDTDDIALTAIRAEVYGVRKLRISAPNHIDGNGPVDRKVVALIWGAAASDVAPKPAAEFEADCLALGPEVTFAARRVGTGQFP